MSEETGNGNIRSLPPLACASVNLKKSELLEEYTLDEAVNKVGFGAFQHKLTFIVGVIWAADAIEMVILSIIGTILACEWTLYRWQLAALTTGVFVGTMIGSPIFGVIADRHGRKRSLTIALLLTLVFGAASSASPSYYWMLVLRTCTGVGLSGLPQGLTLCCEYFPNDIRGKAGMYLCYFWSIGTFGVVLMSWVIMEQTNSWRILLGICAIPTLVAIITLKWLVESARYCMVSDNFEQAQKIVEKMAKGNGKSLPPGNLQMIENCNERGCLSHLLSPEYRKSTLLFCYLSAATSFSYYGVTFISPFIVQSGNLELAMEGNASSDQSSFDSIVPCSVISREDYIDLLWTSAAELPGLFLFTIVLEKCSRKMFLSSVCLISSVLVFLLLVKTHHRIVILVFLFGARGILVGVFQLTYVMISESFPTTLRAVAVGLGAALAKVGGLVSSYVSQVLIITNPVLAICILGAVILFAAIAAACLPLETRGLVLLDSHVKDKPLMDKDS